jgi:hypothetical protein
LAARNESIPTYSHTVTMASRAATKRPTGLGQPGAVERQPQWPALDGDLPTARFKLLTSAKTPASARAAGPDRLKLQMKREAHLKLNRSANEVGVLRQVG